MRAYAGQLPDLQGLRVFAAMRLNEAHNKSLRATAEVGIVREEMRKYLDYCSEHLQHVLVDIRNVSAWIGSLNTAIPASYHPQVSMSSISKPSCETASHCFYLTMSS